MDSGGLAGTGENHRFTFARFEIGGEFLGPCEVLGIGNFRSGNADTQFAGDLRGDPDDLARRDPQAMIRHATGEGEGTFHHVEAVHFRRIRLVGVAFAFGLAAIKKRSDRALVIVSGKVAVERKNAVRFREIRHQLHAIAKRGGGGIAGQRFVLIEFRGGIFARELLGQAGAGRAVIGTEDESDFRGLIGGKCSQCGLQIRAWSDFRALEDFPRARWRIKIQHRCLGEGVRAFSIRMEIVRSHLGRTAFEGRHHQRRRSTGARHRGSVISRFPGNHPLGSLGVRNDVGFRATAGCHSESGQRGGRAHDLEERTARCLRILLVRHLGGSLRELTVEPLTEVGGILELTHTAPGDGGFAGGNLGVLQNAFAHIRLRK